MIDVVEVQMRWGDMDAQGHVNNAAYVIYLEDARTRFLERGPKHLLDDGIVVVSHQVEYRAPIMFSAEPLQIAMGCTHVGGARIELAYEIYHEGSLRARATTALCPFDFVEQRPKRLSDEDREWFKCHPGPQIELEPVVSPPLHGRGTPIEMCTRWSDCDQYGHVNNVRFFEYAQEARIRVRLIPVAHDPVGTASVQMDPTQHLWLAVRQDVDYIAQMANRPEPYEVVSAPVRLGNSSMVLTSEITDPLDGGRVLASARAVMVYADSKGIPTPLPDVVREAMTPHLVTA